MSNPGQYVDYSIQWWRCKVIPWSYGDLQKEGRGKKVSRIIIINKSANQQMVLRFAILPPELAYYYP